jgi:hypothetical protein
MTHHPEIWDCLRQRLPKGESIQLEEIYSIVEAGLTLDNEDYARQSPSSDIPKWKRDVRNVLQYRKRTGEIEWDGHGGYKI